MSIGIAYQAVTKSQHHREYIKSATPGYNPCGFIPIPKNSRIIARQGTGKNLKCKEETV